MPKKIGEEIDSQNKVLDKKYLVKKMLGEIILGSNNLFGQKTFVKKNFGLKILGKKNVIFGLNRIIWKILKFLKKIFKKNLVKKNLVKNSFGSKKKF